MVESLNLMMVLGVLAQIAQQAHPFGNSRVVGYDHAAIAIGA
jgi:hypothetical protein